MTNRIGAIGSQDNTSGGIQKFLKNPMERLNSKTKGAFVATLINKDDFSKTGNIPGLPSSAGFIDVQNRYS